MIIHEDSYKGFGISAIVHKSRLRKIAKIIGGFSIPDKGKLADFGCSNGYLLEILLESIPQISDLELFGFDHSKDLLEAARSKNIHNVSFEHIDLNNQSQDTNNSFDIVTCFETLEHVGNTANALDTLIGSCKSGGTILLSLPNEVGFQGLLKYVGRKVLRKNAYGDFFQNHSELNYFWRLITNKPITIFRTPESDGWGPHLGFDWKIIVEHIKANSTCEILKKHNSFLGFNYIFIIKKY